MTLCIIHMLNNPKFMSPVSSQTFRFIDSIANSTCSLSNILASQTCNMKENSCFPPYNSQHSPVFSISGVGIINISVLKPKILGIILTLSLSLTHFIFSSGSLAWSDKWSEKTSHENIPKKAWTMIFCFVYQHLVWYCHTACKQ